MFQGRNPDHRSALTQEELNVFLSAHERLSKSQRDGSHTRFANAKLDGLNLANRHLPEVDFSGVSMVGTNAYGTNFHRANLLCADLRECNLSAARLVRANMRGALICSARLAFAVLDGADLRAATIAYRGPNAGKEAQKSVSVDFSNASAKGASFSNARLDGANFSGAILEGADFKNATLANATFKNAVLTGVNLAELAVPAEALEGCVTDAPVEAVAAADKLAAMIEAHGLIIATGGAKGARAVLDGQDIRPVGGRIAGLPLTGLSARNVMAIGTDFTACQLQGARFDGSDLRGCNFTGADLRGASFQGANLAHASFEKAHLGSLRLPDGTRMPPNFTASNMTQMQLLGAILEDDPAALGMPFAGVEPG